MGWVLDGAVDDAAGADDGFDEDDLDDELAALNKEHGLDEEMTDQVLSQSSYGLYGYGLDDQVCRKAMQRQRSTHANACTHTSMHTCPHVRTLARVHMLRCARTDARTCACARTHARTNRRHPHTHARELTLTLAHARTCATVDAHVVAR